MFYLHCCLWSLLQEKTPPVISAHDHQGKLAPGRNNSPPVKHCEDPHGEMKDHQANRAETVVREVSHARGQVHGLEQQARAMAEPSIVTRQSQGPKRNWRKHSVRQGISCTVKLEPLWVEGRSWCQHESKTPRLKEEKDVPDIRRESRPWKQAIWED